MCRNVLLMDTHSLEMCYVGCVAAALNADLKATDPPAMNLKRCGENLHPGSTVGFDSVFPMMPLALERTDLLASQVPVHRLNATFSKVLDVDELFSVHFGVEGGTQCTTIKKVNKDVNKVVFFMIDGKVEGKNLSIEVFQPNSTTTPLTTLYGQLKEHTFTFHTGERNSPNVLELYCRQDRMVQAVMHLQCRIAQLRLELFIRSEDFEQTGRDCRSEAWLRPRRTCSEKVVKKYRHKSKMIPPLTSARLVCREESRLAPLGHVALTVSSFLDYSRLWTITSACARGLTANCNETSLRLLDRIVAHQEENYRNLAARKQRDTFYRQWEFTRACSEAAKRGDLNAIQWLVTTFPECRVTAAVEEAAKHGELKVLQWFFDRARNRQLTVFWGARELFFAGKYGHLEVAKWLHEHTAPPPTHMFFVTLEEAARNGDLPMVRWLCEVRGEWSPYAAVLAASRGHLEVLQWLRTNLFSSSSSSISMDDAAAGGFLQVLVWLQDHSGYATAGAMNKAAASGHLEVVRWLHEHRQEGCTSDAMNLAAAHGHLEIVQWLHNNRQEGCTFEAMDGAAKHGHLDIVLWLHANRTEGCSQFAMDRAAAKGHLAVAQWLHENRTEGCTTSAMDGAARSNRLEMLQWLHENRAEGCTQAAMNLAAKNGHLAIVQWLHEHRTEGGTTDAMDFAAANNHLDVVKWLHAHRTEGCTANAMDNAAAGGFLEIVQWLHENRKEGCTKAAMNNAAAGGHLKVVQWLHEERKEGCTAAAMDRAASGGHFDVLYFLHCERFEGCSTKAFVNATAAGELEILQWLFADYRKQLGRDRLRIYALGKFYILHWLKMEAGENEREAFMGEANALVQG